MCNSSAAFEKLSSRAAASKGSKLASGGNDFPSVFIIRRYASKTENSFVAYPWRCATLAEYLADMPDDHCSLKHHRRSDPCRGRDPELGSEFHSPLRHWRLQHL